MTTSRPHPPSIPVHPIQEDGRIRYQPLDYQPLANGRQPDGPPPNPHRGRRTYHAFQGKYFRIPTIVEFVVGIIGIVLSGLLIPFGTSPAHIVCAIGFVGSVIILNAACCTVYAYKWKTRKTIVVAIVTTILSCVVSVLLIIAPVVSLLRDRHVVGLVLQIFLILVGIAELGISSYIVKNSITVLRDKDNQRQRQIQSITGDESSMVHG